MKVQPAFLLFLIVLLFVSCGENSQKRKGNLAQDRKTVNQTAPQKKLSKDQVQIELHQLKIPVPKNYQICDSIYGDLDKDGIDELAVIYFLKNETPDPVHGDIPRTIIIYKYVNSKWLVMEESKNAIPDGRPDRLNEIFQGFEIKKGVLITEVGGGGMSYRRQKDTYRYQNGHFELIGYYSIEGNICGDTEEIDFNLSTGKLIFEKEVWDCSDTDNIYQIGFVKDKTVWKDLQLTLKNRYNKDYYIELEESGEKAWIMAY